MFIVIVIVTMSWSDQLLIYPSADKCDLYIFGMRLQILELVPAMLLVFIHVTENYWERIV